MVNKKILAIIQARYNSTRLPGKVCKNILNEISVLEVIIRRLKKSKNLSQIVIATSDDINDAKIIKICKKLNVKFYVGSEFDVLDRFYKTAIRFKANHILRITADCPLVDPALIDSSIKKYLEIKPDYLSNTIDSTYPDGLDIEIFSFSVLRNAWNNCKDIDDREHVTPYIIKNKKFKKISIKSKDDYSFLRLTIDHEVDLKLIKHVYNHFKPNIYFSLQDVIKLRNKNKKIFNINNYLKRNEGMKIKIGQKLWLRAKDIIPGGNQFLSKKSELYLPDQWPAYFKKSKGCYVTDLSNRKYLDMTMGIGTNILGYANSIVDNAVKKIIDKGIMSTLNCPEEVELAEKFLSMHPWAEQAKFARTGGEANAIAVRLARTYSKKTNIAICGYHGWHDWYLASNIKSKKNLDEHLLSGLEPNGVPKNLKNTIFSFSYNNFNQLQEIIRKNNIGIIKMEVARNFKPTNNFLIKVRKIATKNNIILIFDECTSGFRQNLGGLHKLYKVNPDIAVFGKSLGNGYPITAIIGKKRIMSCAKNTFISSTFWSERIGYVAALKTIEVMEKTKSWKKITNIGNYIRRKWKEKAKKYSLPIKISGLAALSTFYIDLPNKLKYKTFITQEMLKSGIITNNSIYVCIDHNKKNINKYLKILDICFKKIAIFEKKQNIDQYLEGPVCQTSFKRLN